MKSGSRLWTRLVFPDRPRRYQLVGWFVFSLSVEDDGSFLSNSDTGVSYCIGGLVDTIVFRVSISVLERWSMWSDWPGKEKKSCLMEFLYFT